MPARLRALLVDDNVFNQKVGLQKLVKMGHEVTVVGSGTDALAALDCTRFDIVFMDLHMKDMDGLEATRRIREREAGTERHTPVIAMTARAMKEDRELCFASGMDGFVSKPIRDADLLRGSRRWHRAVGVSDARRLRREAADLLQRRTWRGGSIG